MGIENPISENFHLIPFSLVVHHLLNQITSPTLLIALDTFQTGKLPQYLAKKLSPDLERYSIYTYTLDKDAELAGSFITKQEVAALHEAVKKLNKPMQFGRLDGTNRIIYQCTKTELLNVL